MQLAWTAGIRLLRRIAIGVQIAQLAVIQFLDPALDLGAVADDNPDEIIRTDQFLGCRPDILGFEGAHLSGVRLVVALTEVVCLTCA